MDLRFKVFSSAVSMQHTKALGKLAPIHTCIDDPQALKRGAHMLPCGNAMQDSYHQ